MPIQDGLYEQMITAAEAAEEIISEALEAIDACEQNCPVCAASSGALEAMLETVRLRRHESTERTLTDPQTGRDLTIATFAMIESFKAHAIFTLNLTRVAHTAFDDIAEGRTSIMISSNSGSIREAAEAVIKRCDAADAAIKAASGKHGPN